MTHDPQLDDWAAAWQAIDDPLSWMREDFLRRKRRADLETWLTVIALAAGTTLLCWRAITSPTALVWVATATLVPADVYLIVRALRQASMRMAAPPLSSRDYLQAMRRNLALREARLAQDQRWWPFWLVVPWTLIAWICWRAPTLSTFALVLGVVVPSYAYALHTSYVREPRAIADERRRLDEIEAELATPDGVP